jgi:hypothetical protein
MRQQVYMILIGNFTLWVNSKETEVRGSDHWGDFRIVQRRDQVELQFTMGGVDLVARQLKEFTQQSSNSIGLSIRLRGYSCNANANYNKSFQL